MKRMLSFVLTLVLLIGLIPMTAFATEVDSETQNTEPTVVTEVDTSAANTSISSNPDLFVFAGQSNMMGAAVLEPEVNTFTEQAWEYKYMPKLRGAETGTFVPAQNSAGEWYYNDLNAAYGDYLNDLTYRSSLSNYSQNTYFCPAMSNGTKGFSAQSEANMCPSASLPPYFVTEYASYGHSSIYAHMAKGSVKIVHYFTTDMIDTYNALISEYNAENGKSYKLLTTADLTGAGDAFDEKYESMLEDYAACTPDGSINNKCFVWLQGESDGSSYIEYKLKMRVLWEHLQTLGFTHFFVLRVGYWGNTGILDIIKAQEDFCAENEGCYIVTRAPSLIPHPTATTENWWINEPDAQYADCRDSYVVPGSGNHHFNEKAMQIFAERSAENIHRILYQGLEPVLEEENIQGLVKEEQKPEEEQPEDTTPYASYVGTDDFNKGLSVSTSSGKWVEKTSSTAASTDLIPVTSDDSVWIQYVFYLSEAHAVGGFYDKDSNLVAPLYYKDFGFSLGGGSGTAAFLTPEATNRVSIADVESATGKEIAYVRFTAWQASAGGHANTEARIYHSHSYTPTVTAPTCTEQGYTTYTCDCGESYVNDHTGTVEHTYISGKCSVCGKSKLGADWLAPEFAEGDYSMVVLPDTQNMVDYWPEFYYKQMQWIADNKDALNIQAVLHMGDMVNTNNDTQWTACENGTDILENAGIPWMPMMGNHDDSKWFNEYYDYATYGSNQSWFGGSYHSNKLDHTYWFVTVGERDYMILSLGWAPSWDVLAWAQDIVEAHSDKNVIITCHAYMNKDGTLLSKDDSLCVSAYLPGYPNGDDVWAAFKKYENVVLAMSGHIYSADIVTYVDQNGDGRNVTSLLVDRQNDDTGSHLGMVAVLTFHADSNSVDVNWYSTSYDALYRSKNQLTISVPHVCDHTFTSSVTEPTCAEGGGTRYTCTLCDLSYADAVSDPLGHDYQAVVTAPTCTTKGYTTLTCSRCGDSKWITETFDITEQFVWSDGKMIIATTGASTAYTYWQASDFVDISGYTSLEIKTANTASASTSTGLAFYDANKNYISGIKHTDGSGVYGVLIHNIEVPENAVYIRSTWYSDCHPNYKSAFGSFYCIGTVVDYTEPLGHDYDAVVTAPTCTEQGYTTYTCACGDSYVGDYVDATGEHDFTDWYTTKEASYNADGEESRDCKKCSHVEFRSVKPEVVTSGNVGKGTPYTDDVTYTLYADGTMVISGNGIVYCSDWRGDYQPYKDYRTQVKTLIVEEGITTTAGGCFAHFYNLETVSLPDSLTKIDGNAFMSSFSSSITSIVIPETVTYIGAYSYGFYYGKGGTTFTDIIIENPNVRFVDNKAVFNSGNNLENLTLYSYGTNNNVSAYAQKYGCKYVDLEAYKTGIYSGVEYMYYDGVLTLSATENDATIAGEDAPWNAQKNNIQKIVIESGITSIAANAFKDYYNLKSIEINNEICSVGDGAFATTESCDCALTLVLPRTVKSVGSEIFAGRQNVILTAYLGSAAAEINESGVTLDLKKQFKLLLIGNSYSEDASSCGQGMQDSQLLNILQAMLGEDAEVTVALLSSGGKGINWHATQAEQGNAAYSFKIISSNSPTWTTIGSASSYQALTWTDWDVVSLQPYNISASTGIEAVAYPDGTDMKFRDLKTASEYLLDYIGTHAPDADIYCYMHWAQTTGTTLNANLSYYNRLAPHYLAMMEHEGMTTGTKYTSLIPVGLSIQNARSTYLALLAYNTDATLNLTTDTQMGLQRDGGHLSFNVGRYIAGLTFAEMIVPEEWRAEDYLLPDIRITESVGKLPKEYTIIAQKAVKAAVDSWKQGSLAVTDIAGYKEDPTIATSETLKDVLLNLPCDDTVALTEQIRVSILEILPADFAVDNVDVSADSGVANVTIRFGYTAVTVEVLFTKLGHDYSAEWTVDVAPACTTAGSKSHHCTGCDKKTDVTEIPSTGHTYGAWYTIKAPTCTEKGTDEHKCSACQHTETRTVSSLGHTESAAVVENRVNATCAAEGSYDSVVYCSVCGYELSRKTNKIDKLDHTYTTVVTKPTCTKQGYTTHTCVCGDSYVDTYVEALGHNFGEWYTTVDPTESVQGEKRRDCSKCDTYETSVIEVLDHDHYRWEIIVLEAKAPTCTESGLTEGSKCSKCGEILAPQNTVPATGHTFGKWYTTKAPTCTAKGEEKRECANCDRFETRTVDKIAHTYTTVATPPTCTKQGYTTHTCKCGDSYVDTYVDATGHSYGEWYTTKSPTCTAIGTECRDCGDCGHYEERSVAALGHDEIDHSAKAPTCTEIGWYSYVTCSRCDYTTYVEIKSLGHEYSSAVIKPDCENGGYTTHTCSRCGDSYTDSKTDALGHTEVIDKAVSATCTETGLTEGKHCSVCGKVLVAQQTVEATGHTASEWIVDKEATYEADGSKHKECTICREVLETSTIPMLTHSYTSVVTAPTCTEQGYTTHICSDCGDSYVDTYVDATGHSYGEWYTTKSPTCTAIGTERRDCGDCGHYEERSVVALGHDEIDHSAKAPTCTEIGWYSYVTCSRCDYTTYVEIKSLGHEYSSAVTKPDCESGGYTTHTCSRCGDSYTDSKTDALGHTEVIDKAVSATCTETGLTEGKHCSVCGKVLVAQQTVEATGHTFGKWYETKTPTCTAKGEEKRECANCDRFETRTVDKIAHTYTTVVTKPTCTKQGYTTHTCVCGDSYVDTYVEAAGHSFTNYVSDGNATFEADGTKTAVCDNGCGVKDTVTDEGSKLKHNDITSEIYEVKDNLISGISVKTTVKELKESVNETGYVRVVKDGKVVADNTALATGMKIQLMNGTEVVKEVTVVVTGDTNGDGNISVTDMISVKAHILEKSTLTDAYGKAGDTNGDGKISITDFIQIKAHILGKSSLEKRSVKAIDTVTYNAAPVQEPAPKKETAKAETVYTVCVADFLVPAKNTFLMWVLPIKRSF